MHIKGRAGIGPVLEAEALVLGPESSRETTSLSQELKGKIVVCTDPVGKEFIAKALYLGIAGLVLPSIHYRDLWGFTGGEEITIVLLKKFGEEALTEAEQKDVGHWNGKKLTISKENNLYAIETTS